MNFIYFEQASKLDPLDIPIVIETLLLIISGTIDPYRFLLTVRYHELFDKEK